MGGPKHQGTYAPTLNQPGIDCTPGRGLTVNKSGTGSGTVSSNPSGIDCGADCAEDYDHGSVVTLVATPTGGSTFAGWSGACLGMGTCTLTMNSSKSVTATFAAPLTFAFSVPAEGEVGVAYSASLILGGGVPPYTVSITSGSLPAGLDFHSSNISGTPAFPGTSSFTVQVTDQVGSSESKKLKIKVFEALNLTTSALKTGRVGKKYSHSLKATGGKKPYTWSLASESPGLPAGLNLDSVTGKITGTSAASGTFDFTVQVADPLGGQAQKSFTLTIN